MTESAYDLLGIRKDFPERLRRRGENVVDPELDVRLAGRIRELSRLIGGAEITETTEKSAAEMLGGNCP